MIMDSHFNTLPDYFDDFKFTDGTTFPSIEQSLHNGYGLEYVENSMYSDFTHKNNFLTSADFVIPHPSLNEITEISSPYDHESDAVVKFVNRNLFGESLAEELSMIHDPLTLQATEKSFYDVISKKYSTSPTLTYPRNVDVNATSVDSVFGITRENSLAYSNTGCSSVDHLWNEDQGSIILAVEQSQPSTDTQPLVNPVNSSSSNYNGQIDSSLITNLDPSFLSSGESVLLFQKGMEEAMKFLPTNNQLNIDSYQYKLPPKSEEGPPKVTVKGHYFESCNRGKKHLHHQDSELETQRSRKQSAVYEDEGELSELFDKVLLSDVGELSSSRKVLSKKQGENDAVDFRTLLSICARAVSSNDHRATNEQLNKIRKHASSTGDSSQRLANIISDGIEARLAGTGTQIYAALTAKKMSAVEKLKSYQVYLSASPFMTIAMYFANEMILKTAAKASSLHIVDFGIEYGFQWPMLIQSLSSRQGGPPKLRITGIEFPLSGFRPTEKIEETGRRLAKYCERFSVPFEYQAIATKSWEKINIDDLKLARLEVVAVNVHVRLKNLLDETVSVVEDSPRDATLKLIREMKPDIFVLAEVNGSFNSPFFVPRFKETLLYYSALFDMLDATMPRDDEQRYNIENEFYQRLLMNIIACEGPERVERPDTYKHWECRIMRAGLKLLPIDKTIVEKLKAKVESGYHKDFVLDDNGYWILQGWKGRILYTSSCWVSG